MIIAGNQPYFIPYIAYWQLMTACDLFLIGDDYAFIKDGWVQRNRILRQGKPTYFGLEISKISPNRLINQTELIEINSTKKLKDLYYCYHSAPFFNRGYSLMEKIFSFPEKDLTAFLVNSIEIIREYLGIKTKMMFTSQIEGNCRYKCEQRIFDFCDRLGGTTYINAIGGQSLYKKDEFAEHGIELKFIHSHCREYKQLGGAFVPGLSILDVIMFNSREEIAQMLGEFTLE
ncbi:WbqC family protein [uncultured Fibrobacter sp.]|uniref:WbqC family protein n=1 Tax=uncultured Fibrobacter sp. TaxID=261512 RepID=UPI0025D1DE14|nr:WbqC family protein [uncultured Fibrobacter sp.]